MQPQGRETAKSKEMSLALLGGYSSAEEEENNEQLDHRNQYSSDEDSDSDGIPRKPATYNPVDAAPNPSGGSSVLPSALEVFSEIAGPPEFLSNCVEEHSSVRESIHRGRRRKRDKKDLPAGVVVEAKAQLVGIHERVRSDVEGSRSTTSSTQPQKGSAPVGGKQGSNATDPDKENASQLLRMCLQCGIPKTYSSERGMFCPICADKDDSAKKKGSAVKDKEKIKRMRGQSSHATWKSETEMQLRQHFD